MQQQAGAPRYLTAVEIAAGTGWKLNSIYWLAQRDHWRRRDRHNPARYHAEDVLATISRRELGRRLPTEPAQTRQEAAACDTP